MCWADGSGCLGPVPRYLRRRTRPPPRLPLSPLAPPMSTSTRALSFTMNHTYTTRELTPKVARLSSRLDDGLFINLMTTGDHCLTQ